MRGAGALATVGSSLSPGRGRAGARDGSVRSGSAASRVGGGRSFGTGSSFGAGFVGGSSAERGGRSGVGRPCGAPTVATAGTRFTTEVFGWAGRQAAAPA